MPTFGGGKHGRDYAVRTTASGQQSRSGSADSATMSGRGRRLSWVSPARRWYVDAASVVLRVSARAQSSRRHGGPTPVTHQAPGRPTWLDATVVERTGEHDHG